jgi:hypothetical protein
MKGSFANRSDPMKKAHPTDKTLPARPVAEELPPPMGHNMPPPEAVLNAPAMLDPADDELWDAPKVRAYFGGVKPIHISTLYRGIDTGIYPPPIYVSANSVRWVPHECRAARQRMIAARDQPKPKPAKPRGRKPGQRIERKAAATVKLADKLEAASKAKTKTKTATETEDA